MTTNPETAGVEPVGLTANSMHPSDLVEGIAHGPLTPLDLMDPVFRDSLPRWIIQGWTGEEWDSSDEESQGRAEAAAKSVIEGASELGVALEEDEFATLEEWEHEDQFELSLLYNHRADDSLQFNRGQMRAAIRHGRRIALANVIPAPASNTTSEGEGLVHRLRSHFADCPKVLGERSSTRDLLEEAANAIEAFAAIRSGSE